MAQTKKTAVSRQILESARRQFQEKGYAGTTLASVAKEAGFSASNTYIYFPSKMALFMAVFEPWFRDKIRVLLDEVASIDDRSERLKAILMGLWQTIPRAENGFANNLMQALSLLKEREQYSDELLKWVEAMIREALRDCMDDAQAAALDFDALVHLIIMVSDGFTLQERIKEHPDIETERAAELFRDLLLAERGD